MVKTGALSGSMVTVWGVGGLALPATPLLEPKRRDAMRNCEYVWDPVRAQQVSELVERATGKPCPCKEGGQCPFVRVEDPPPISLGVPEIPERRAG